MEIERLGKREALRELVAPAFKALLAEAVPRGSGAQAIAQVSGISAGDESRPIVGKNSSALRYLNKVRDEDGIVQPSPSKTWEIADAALALNSNQWCAGPLFLFAAGHLGEFARTIAVANEKAVTPERKLALINAVRTAVDPRAIPTIDELRAEMRAKGITDTTIQKEVRRVREGKAGFTRPDRNVWILTSVERAAFDDAFLDRSQLPHSYQVAVVTAQLAAENPGLGITMVHDVTQAALRQAFT